MELQILLMDGSQEVIHLNYLVTLKIHHSQPIFKPKPKLKLLKGLGLSFGLVHAYLRLMEKDQTPREFNHNFKSSFAFRQLT